MEDELLDLDPGDSLEKGRPSFLSGLCVTSWAGSAFTLLTNVYSLLMLARMDGNGITAGGNYLAYMFGTIGCALVVAIGVFGMWNLKRWGFYVYLIGELFPIALSVFQFSELSMINEIGINAALFSLSGIISYFIPVIFCILYGVNYKFLK